MPPRVSTGLENLTSAPPPNFKQAKLGLLLNQASIDHNLRYSCDIVAGRFPHQLVTLFSPQHGFWGEEQANMIESCHSRYDQLELPIFSLYSETRRPTAAMLKGLDCFLVDLQDVGTRVYTFVWTILECLRACAECGVRMVVLDRPNPLGGEVIEGPVLERHLRSFVGGASIPLRHGLTPGELALFLNETEEIHAELSVVPMSGWKRSMLFTDTGLPWVAPSPNMPQFETAVLYPGQVLLEGTNLSEGRGTTQPFQVCGAPYLDADAFAGQLARNAHPGVQLRPVRFRPVFDKWQHQTCHGVAIHVCEPRRVRSVKLTVAIIEAARRLAPKDFRWLDPPYEYEFQKLPIDILFGSERLRCRLESAKPLEGDELEAFTSIDVNAWKESVAPFLLYDS